MATAKIIKMSIQSMILFKVWFLSTLALVSNMRRSGSNSVERKKHQYILGLSHQQGKVPVIRIWSRVLLSPYFCTACWPALYPSPYTGEMSASIWCLKNSPSFFSNWDRVPFFDELELKEDEEVDAEFPSEPDISSASSHMWATTWQIPSSTSWLRVR